MHVTLQHFERARLDRDRLESLVRELGEPGAERIVGRAMEELAVRLSRLEVAYKAGDLAAVAKAASSMVAVADQVGMASMARVARDVTITAHAGDGAGFAATVARLLRVGEASLMSVWDLQDMSV